MDRVESSIALKTKLLKLMAHFITRVELHDAKLPDDYTLLHEKMNEKGFSRILRTQGEGYHLPTAEYVLISNLVIANVKILAIQAASQVKKKFSLLITQAAEINNFSQIAWENLERVK